MKTTICLKEQRREEVRTKTNLNGLDYLDVGDDQLTLTVYFLGKAPQHLTKDNFTIKGGRRIQGIEVLDVEVTRDPDPEMDDTAKLILNRFGDFSVYTLRLVDVDEPIDPYYDQLDFTFKVDCPSDLDCKRADICPPEVHEDPQINYLVKDYAGFRQLILDRLALVMPDWQERHVPDLGIALVEVLAYMGDQLSYYQDAVATESYLDTARQRISIRRHARLVDYRMHDGCNARAWVCVEVAGHVQLNPADAVFIAGLRDVLPQEQRVLSVENLHNLQPNSFLAFEPLVVDHTQGLQLREEHNTIPFYTWGQRECCLVKGSTSATLLDGWVEAESAIEKPQLSRKAQNKKTSEAPQTEHTRALALQLGDVLILEEYLGPTTGEHSDADPALRHAVRLTKVEACVDPLDGTPILEVEWSEEDALPFPLCLSAVTDADHGCEYHTDVSVAHGNVVMVDHGMTIETPEKPYPGEVPVERTETECFCEGLPGEVTLFPGRYRATLAKTSVTYREDADFSGPATKAMLQDPRNALPQIRLIGRQQRGSKVIEVPWEIRFDLLSSGLDDAHFVVEIDNDGRVHLRFGDGDCGRMPEAGTTFSAVYRVGNGRAGNIGAEAIGHLAYRKEKPDGIEGVRNPLTAEGGSDPEPVSEVKLFAPTTFRTQLERAVTTQDYADIVMRDFPTKVQRATASLAWNGSSYEVQVAIDPKGTDEANDILLCEIGDHLSRFRRMGHDVHVAAARYVWLDIALEVCVKPDYLRGHIKSALLDLFNDRVLTSGKLGFFHPDNLTFGGGIFASRIIATAMGVEGVQSAILTRLQRQFEAPNRELENGVLPLGALEIGRCDNDPSFPEHGRIDIAVMGGR